MADQQVKVILQGEDKTGPAFKSATGNVSGLADKVVTLAKGFIAFEAVKKVGEVMIGLAEGAADAQASLARVSATLTAMGPAALKNKDAIVQMSQSAVQLGFDDEAAAESITRFYQATGSLTEAQKLNNLAMDLARAKSLDLGTATNLVNQVLAGNGRALKAYQINLKDSATPLEALGELQDKVGGQAKNFSETFSGQTQILTQEFDNMKDTIGTALIEAVIPFVKELSAWAADPKVINQVKSIATTMGDLAKTTIPILIDAVKIMYGWFMNFYNALVNIEVQLFKVIDAIGTAVDKAKSISSTVGTTLKGGVSGVASGAVSEVSHLLTGKASGGPVSGGTPYIVGEKGPELFVPGQSGSIIPNGAGGLHITINNPMLLDDAMISRVGKQIARMLGTDLRY